MCHFIACACRGTESYVSAYVSPTSCLCVKVSQPLEARFAAGSLPSAWRLAECTMMLRARIGARTGGSRVGSEGRWRKCHKIDAAMQTHTTFMCIHQWKLKSTGGENAFRTMPMPVLTMRPTCRAKNDKSEPQRCHGDEKTTNLNAGAAMEPQKYEIRAPALPMQLKGQMFAPRHSHAGQKDSNLSPGTPHAAKNDKSEPRHSPWSPKRDKKRPQKYLVISGCV